MITMPWSTDRSNTSHEPGHTVADKKLPAGVTRANVPAVRPEHVPGDYRDPGADFHFEVAPPESGLRAFVIRADADEATPHSEIVYALDIPSEQLVSNALLIIHDCMEPGDELIQVIDEYGGGIERTEDGRWAVVPPESVSADVTYLTCRHGPKVRILIEHGEYEVALCPASETANPDCWPEFRNVVTLGGPIPFVLGPQYGGEARASHGEIIWNVTLADLPPRPRGAYAS